MKTLLPNVKINRNAVLTLLVAVLFLIVLGAFFLNSKGTQPVDGNNEVFTVLDENGNQVDYTNGFPTTNIKNLRERIFSTLVQNLKQIEENGGHYDAGKVIYTANNISSGVLAVFNFANNNKINLENYIESPLFGLPFIFSQFVDIDGDGHDDIFAISHSGNYLDLEMPWFLLYRDGQYVLATTLTPSGVDKEKALTGKASAQNAMEIRAHAGVFAVWLRDLDGDNSMEAITLDRGTFSDSEEITELTKRVYRLNNGAYILQSESQINRDSDEYKEIKSWPTFPGLKSN